MFCDIVEGVSNLVILATFGGIALGIWITLTSDSDDHAGCWVFFVPILVLIATLTLADFTGC